MLDHFISENIGIICNKTSLSKYELWKLNTIRGLFVNAKLTKSQIYLFTQLEFNMLQPQALYGYHNWIQVMSGLNLIDKNSYSEYITKWGLNNRLMSKHIELDIRKNQTRTKTHKEVLEEINI